MKYHQFALPEVISRRHVLNAKLSDPEIITISICGELAGIDSENAWFSSVIFLIESVVLCALFTVLILSKMNKPLSSMIYSYPPAIVDRVIELGLIADTDRKTSSTKKALKQKWPAVIVFGIVLGVFVW